MVVYEGGKDLIGVSKRCDVVMEVFLVILGC